MLGTRATAISFRLKSKRQLARETGTKMHRYCVMKLDIVFKTARASRGRLRINVESVIVLASFLPCNYSRLEWKTNKCNESSFATTSSFCFFFGSRTTQELASFVEIMIRVPRANIFKPETHFLFRGSCL